MEFIVGLIITCLVSYYVFFSSVKKKEKKENLSVEELCAWQPKPLIEPKATDDSKEENLLSVVLNGKVGKIISIDGKELINFATHNYLNLIENDCISERAKKAIFKYGVGSCGPRGFYGTVDVHLELESRLAKFMNAESAIVYSYGFTTIASAIAAYAKKNDVIYADERVNFAIQRGMEASRCKIFYFKHNDMDDLVSLLENHEAADTRKKSQSTVKKFLIVEGIYVNSGRVCPLPELIEIKKRFKIRLFIDESVSFGVLGKNGRGVIEHFNIDNEDVDMIMASLENALGTSGGFCVGSAFIVEHQRLSGLGYCFSAALPPFLAVAACAGLDIIEEQPNERVVKLANRCRCLHLALKSSAILCKYYRVECDECSPIQHLILSNNNDGDYRHRMSILNKIALRCRDEGVLVTPANYLIEKEHSVPPASIRLTVSAQIEDEQIERLVRALELASHQILPSFLS